MVTSNAVGAEELRGTLLVSVHDFGDGFHALVTVLGTIGTTRNQAEADGDKISTALCLAVEKLFTPTKG